ncbi:RidA family protein [Marinicella meishanensis]|uniref:RidA family protein n=1 Tax=Marinicella meishanensis TaxID=2873263 RepID=UPI001CBB5524|nr:RidA family protein [Marinicella sp. NBU2979]
MKKQISSGSAFEAEYAYSRAVIDGQYVFVSGTTGYDYATMTISEDVVTQTEQCFENIKLALSAAGCGLHDVVRIHYLLPDKDDFARCAPVLRQYLSDSRPAATMMVVGLLDDKMKIEIEVTARLPA